MTRTPRRYFDGVLVAPVPKEITFRVGDDAQVIFTYVKTGRDVKVDMAGTNYGYVKSTDRMLVVLDGQVFREVRNRH